MRSFRLPSNYKASPCPSNVLEARAGGARYVRITGKRRVESVSNRLEPYALGRGSRERHLKCSMMPPELVRVIAFLWEGSPDPEIVPENRSLHNTFQKAFSSDFLFLTNHTYTMTTPPKIQNRSAAQPWGRCMCGIGPCLIPHAILECVPPFPQHLNRNDWQPEPRRIDVQVLCAGPVIGRKRVAPE